MAKLVIDGKEKDIPDGDNIMPLCEEEGVPFGCTDGICGVCRIEILEGQDNLTDLTQEEKDLAMDKDARLACQCKIKQGLVKITF